MYLHNILQGSGKGGRKVPPILTAISLILRVAIVFHVPRTCKPTCSVVMAPQVIWEPVSPCKYCVVCTRPRDSCPSVCKYASERWSHLSDVPLQPRDNAVEGKAQWQKHRSYVLWSPSQSTFTSLLYSKKRDFSFVSPAKRYLCVCMCVRVRERESRRERIRLRTWPRQLKGPNSRKSISQSYCEAFELPPDMAQTHQLPLWRWFRTVMSRQAEPPQQMWKVPVLPALFGAKMERKIDFNQMKPAKKNKGLKEHKQWWSTDRPKTPVRSIRISSPIQRSRF